MPIESIWARTSMARVKAAEGDQAEAETTLLDAAAIAEETGAATERAHIDQLLRQLGIRTWRRGARRRTTGDLSGLSEREREIANLIAGGASNPDIAGTLFLSRKTVERHVSSILGKLEVKNRAQLAARIAAGDGLEPENAVSRYKWDLGISWYEETRDSATNFFFEWLPQGEYTFKYRLRANMAGVFRVGPATLQSMYAPEFNAYSTGAVMSVK